MHPGTQGGKWLLKALKLAGDGFPPLEHISPAKDEVIYPRSTCDIDIRGAYSITHILCGSEFPKSLAAHRAFVCSVAVVLPQSSTLQSLVLSEFLLVAEGCQEPGLRLGHSGP